MLLALSVVFFAGFPQVSSAFYAWAHALHQESSKILQAPQEQISKRSADPPRCGVPSLQEPSLRELEKASPPEKPTLLIFVSFSMPLKTLQALADEAQAHQGQLVFRGLVKGSFQKSLPLLKKLQRPVSIDPTLFEDHEVTQVPTFLYCVHKNCDRLKGNVTLTYALEKFQGYRREKQ